MRDMKKPEILAPAGTMDALRAAIYAGADAVYLGGSRFGARAYADNFDNEALLGAIEYAHIYGVKVYLTINTLFRDEEIEELFDYLLPLYEAGLDAVIVQDLGVVSFVHDCFPDLPIHASTQMTITTEYAYTLLEKYGVTRIVPARELSIEEIAQLKCITEIEALKSLKQYDLGEDKQHRHQASGENGPEIEVFVQGALCYSYSGQCLMSSMLGGRSGNRGRCAQTCRLSYDVSDQNGNPIKIMGKHVLSPKDLCGLEHIPDLIKAGVDSFKIEGRMKKAEYVAACVKAYRTCVDAWFEGMYTDTLLETCRQEMAEVFNRGGFTEGYYHKHNGADMMTIENPGNVGVKVGSIVDVNKNKITIKLSKQVFSGDILMIAVKGESITLTCNVDSKAGKQIILNAPRTKLVKRGMVVNRMQQAKLTEELSLYSNKEPGVKISGKLVMKAGTPAKLMLKACIRGEEYKTECIGEEVTKALNKPLLEETIRSKMTATGNTRYEFEHLELKLDDEVFYPLKALKELRRNGLENLEKEICSGKRREFPKGKMHIKQMCVAEAAEVLKENQALTELQNHTVIMVSSMEQHEAVQKCLKEIILRKNYADIYLDLQYFNKEDIINLVQQNKEISYFLVLPSVLRKHNIAEVKALLQMAVENNPAFSGIVVRNLDEFALLKWMNYRGKVVADYSLYAMNRWAVKWLQEEWDGITITLPVELNESELERLLQAVSKAQWTVYGHQQLMISAQCVQNTLKGCNKADGSLVLTDRYQKPFYVRCVCKYCYNLIYNGVPTVLFDVPADSLRDYTAKRLHFTVENGEETSDVLKAYVQEESFTGEKTRGHYRRGVE